MTQQTVLRCDKCGVQCPKLRQRRHSYDLCPRHQSEFEAWLASPYSTVITPQEARDQAPKAPPEPQPPPVHTGPGRRLPDDVPFPAVRTVHRVPDAIEQYPVARGASSTIAAPVGARVPQRTPHWVPAAQVSAPVRATGHTVPGDAHAPARPVAPGFPLPGYAPDPINDHLAARSELLAVVPPTALLTEPPAPPPLENGEPSPVNGPPEGVAAADDAPPVAPLASARVGTVGAAAPRTGGTFLADHRGNPVGVGHATPPPVTLADCTCRAKAFLEMDPDSAVSHARSCVVGHAVLAAAMAQAQRLAAAMPAPTALMSEPPPPPAPALEHPPELEHAPALEHSPELEHAPELAADAPAVLLIADLPAPDAPSLSASP